MCCGNGGARGTLWTAWWVVNLIGLIYFALGFVTCSNLFKAYNQAKDDLADVVSLLVAVFISAFLIMAYAVFSFLLLVCKSVARSEAGFGYGFVTSSAFSLGVVLLLCSFMLAGSKDHVVNKFEKDEDNWGMDWSGSETTMFVSTAYLGFVASFAYLALFALMMIFSRSIGDPEQVSYKEPILEA